VICAGRAGDLYALGGAARDGGRQARPAAYPPVLEVLGIAGHVARGAVGDSPHTDLAGAQAAGALDAVWALTGLAAHAHGAAPDAAHLAAVAAEEGVAPVAALTALRW
jgi:ribonucleotide monophosphatase NagD (HAD superfamily)